MIAVMGNLSRSAVEVKAGDVLFRDVRIQFRLWRSVLRAAGVSVPKPLDNPSGFEINKDCLRHPGSRWRRTRPRRGDAAEGCRDVNAVDVETGILSPTWTSSCRRHAHQRRIPQACSTFFPGQCAGFAVAGSPRSFPQSDNRAPQIWRAVESPARVLAPRSVVAAPPQHIFVRFVEIDAAEDEFQRATPWANDERRGIGSRAKVLSPRWRR